MAEQIPFGTNSFAENPEPRLPCVLLLDTSGSMGGSPIAELNSGVQAYQQALAGDTLAMKRVEVALVTFGGQVQVVSDFTTVDGFHPPVLGAGGDTPMGAAIRQGVEMIAKRKETYKAHGLSHYRPWLVLMTDGGPTDEWLSAADLVKQGETARRFSFFAIGVEGANMETLRQISVREPLKLNGLQFREFFLWLSASQAGVSRSSPGETVSIPKPDWTTV